MNKDKEIILATKCAVLYEHRSVLDRINVLGAAGHLPMTYFEGYFLPVPANDLLIRNRLEVCN